MPAERTRGSRRSGADGTQLVWTEPVAPDTGGIAFATNLTPGEFQEGEPAPPPDLKLDVKLDVAAPSFFLFDPAAPATPKRPSHKRKPASPPSPASPSPAASTPDTDAPHIPRPPNAFILFRSSFIRAGAVPARVEPSHATLSAIAGLTWAALPPVEKGRWHARAKMAREAHRERFPGYAFRPKRVPSNSASSSSNSSTCPTNHDAEDAPPGDGDGDDKDAPAPRRRRCLPPPDRARVAHIAALLAQGMRGPALDDALSAWDAAREREGGGVEVVFGEVWTPEGKGGASAPREKKEGKGSTGKEGKSGKATVKKDTQPRERKTSAARRLTSPPSPPSLSPCASTSTPKSEPTSPTSPFSDTPAPFDFPLDLELDLGGFEWPSPYGFDAPPAFDGSYPSTPASSSSSYGGFEYAGYDNLDNFDSAPASPALAHAPASPFSHPSPYGTFEYAGYEGFDSHSYPASPALSHSSAASPASSAWSSVEDLALRTPLSACGSLEDLASFGGAFKFEPVYGYGCGDAQMQMLLPPYDAGLEMGGGYAQAQGW